MKVNAFNLIWSFEDEIAKAVELDHKLNIEKYKIRDDYFFPIFLLSYTVAKLIYCQSIWIYLKYT